MTKKNDLSNIENFLKEFDFVMGEQQKDKTTVVKNKNSSATQKEWAGRKFQCVKTKQILTIPENVRECDCFYFGECMIDVGRAGFYSRGGGEYIEITEE